MLSGKPDDKNNTDAVGGTAAGLFLDTWVSGCHQGRSNRMWKQLMDAEAWNYVILLSNWVQRAAQLFQNKMGAFKALA